jgi:hypothetical protein
MDDSEFELNFYFCGGPQNPEFKTDGRRLVKGWANKEEYEVLIERVRDQKKPIASIVLKDKSEDEIKRILNLISEKNLASNRFENEWGVDIIYITGRELTTLNNLAIERNLDAFVSSRESFTCQNFIETGFDESEKARCCVSRIESALLLGYPYP